MTDDLEIMHGGAIAVDPQALRAVADALCALAPRIADAATDARRAHALLVGLPGASERVDTVALWASAARCEVLHEECRTAGENTRLASDAYELVERRAELAGLALQDDARAAAVRDRIAELEESDPRIVEMEAWLVAGWEKRRFDGLREQYDLGWPGTVDGPGLDLGVFFAMAATVGGSGAGTLPPGASLTGSGGPVSVRPVRTESPIAPPTSLAEAFRRFPTSDGAQIKVEKYTMADGSRRYALYEKGTQALGVFGHEEPFDMVSNLELYSGQESASYAATVAALKAAGAQPGDQVDVYAHSQAAMNAAYLSSQSEFDVRVQVTAGSPVHPAVADDQLLIELRHTDDVVSALAGGGSPAGTGSQDSIVVTRVGDPVRGPQDLIGYTHFEGRYIETAELVDASADVRLEAIRDRWRELNEAVSIESTEFVARRG